MVPRKLLTDFKELQDGKFPSDRHERMAKTSLFAYANLLGDGEEIIQSLFTDLSLPPPTDDAIEDEWNRYEAKELSRTE